MVFKKTKVKSKKTTGTVASIELSDFLKDVSDDKRFWLCDGNYLQNLVQLRDALAKMNDGVFSYHVNQEKNDFKNWVEGVILDTKLASELAKAKTKKAMFQKVSAAVRNYAK